MSKFKAVKVGDPHVQVSNLSESKILIDQVISSGLEHKAPVVIFMGDLFHTHAVIRAEVMDFWFTAVKSLEEHFEEIWIIDGNHDKPGSKELEEKISATSFLQYASKKIVRFEPGGGVRRGVGAIPYTHNPELFLNRAKTVRAKGAEVLLCHQTFNGAKFENGMYAPDGIDVEQMPNFTVVSTGHIHSAQDFTCNGTLYHHVGTPRWLTSSDANVDKFIEIVEFNGEEPMAVIAKFNMANVIEPFRAYDWVEGEDMPTIPDGVSSLRTVVKLTGSSAWVKTARNKLPEGMRVSTKVTDRKNRKKGGKKTSLSVVDFVTKHFDPVLVSKPDLIEYLEKLDVRS